MQAQSEHFSIAISAKGKLPRLPFADIKNAILGPDYDLSLVFPTRTKAIELHQYWKGKPGPVNILSFPLSPHEGEIFISLDQAKTECKKFDRTYENYVGFLFIHGCVHLKGFAHGTKMEQQEKKYRALFNI